jgi:hypothetical protein
MLGIALFSTSCTQQQPVAGSCEAPAMIREASPAEIRQFFASQGLRVVSFLGYSGAGYENADAMLEQVDRVLQRLDVKTTIINTGATSEGIGAVYDAAKQRGFKTSGIVSSQAKKESVPLAQCVDYTFYVSDDTWGGYDQQTHKLSPTSEAMVTVSDELIAIGGGDIARDELIEAQRLGKKIAFVPADMNHQAAKEKAKKKGQAVPTDFRGSAHESLSK